MVFVTCREAHWIVPATGRGRGTLLVQQMLEGFCACVWMPAITAYRVGDQIRLSAGTVYQTNTAEVTAVSGDLVETDIAFTGFAPANGEVCYVTKVDSSGEGLFLARMHVQPCAGIWSCASRGP